MSFTSSVMERNMDHVSGKPRRKLFEEIYTRSVLYSVHTLNTLQQNPCMSFTAEQIVQALR